MLSRLTRNSGNALRLRIIQPAAEHGAQVALPESLSIAEYPKVQRRSVSGTRAVTALEYGLIAAAIAAVIAGTVFALGATANGMFSAVAVAL